MSANLNKVFLVGNLTKDPELRYTISNTPVCGFSLAINRKYKSGEDWKTEVSFFNVVVWGKIGESCAKYLRKGSSALVEGRLQNRSWEAGDGSKRYATEIVADAVQFLKTPAASGDSQNDDYSQPHDDDSVPY